MWRKPATFYLCKSCSVSAVSRSEVSGCHRACRCCSAINCLNEVQCSGLAGEVSRVAVRLGFLGRSVFRVLSRKGAVGKYLLRACV